MTFLLQTEILLFFLCRQTVPVDKNTEFIHGDESVPHKTQENSVKSRYGC